MIRNPLKKLCGIALLSIAALTAQASPIYNGGPVMTGTSDVYYIWYGDWSNDAAASTLLPTLVTNLSGSSYFNINTTYAGVSNSLSFSGQTTISSTSNSSLYLGGTLTNTFNQITGLVTNALSGGLLPNDPNGIYYVLTDPTILVSGFNTGYIQYCGWHSSTNWGTNTLGTQYGFIGDPTNTASDRCHDPIQVPGANDFGADAMASVIAHELSETVTDPTGTAWWDSISPSYAATAGYENADMCAWNFGTTYKTASGANANVNLNGTNYLLQENWVNQGGGVASTGGYCSLAYAPAKVPEPSSLALFSTMGIAMLVVVRRRKLLNKKLSPGFGYARVTS